MELKAYCASKVQALHATHEFAKSGKPGFDVINIMSSVFVGKKELVTNPNRVTEGTNSTAMSVLLG